eukprot:gene3835-708_t
MSTPPTGALLGHTPITNRTPYAGATASLTVPPVLGLLPKYIGKNSEGNRFITNDRL